MVHSAKRVACATLILVAVGCSRKNTAQVDQNSISDDAFTAQENAAEQNATQGDAQAFEQKRQAEIQSLEKPASPEKIIRGVQPKSSWEDGTALSPREMLNAHEAAGDIPGYNAMSLQMAQKCLTGASFELGKPTQADIRVLEDQTEEQLNKEISPSVSASIPVKGVDISPDLKYTYTAKSTRLSRTRTLLVGYKNSSRLSAGNLILSEKVAGFFDANGNLARREEFLNTCGDSYMTGQDLMAKLLVTAKISYSSKDVQHAFEGEVGIGFSVAGQKIGIKPGIKVKDQNLLKNVKLTLVATQMGGNPMSLAQILTGTETCTLDDLKKCEETLTRLNEYALNTFTGSVATNSPDVWVSSNTQLQGYDGQSFTLGNQNVTPHLYGSNKANVQRAKGKIVGYLLPALRDISTAETLLNTIPLTRAEEGEIQTALRGAYTNAEFLRGYAKDCIRTPDSCSSDASAIDARIETYDRDLLESFPGNFLAGTTSGAGPLKGQKARSSANFFVFRSTMDQGQYNSFYFKIKGTNGQKILGRDNIRFDIKCDKPWYRNFGIDPVILTYVHHNFQQTTSAMENVYDGQCHRDEAIYVASPKNANSEFVVELWGRE